MQNMMVIQWLQNCRISQLGKSLSVLVAVTVYPVHLSFQNCLFFQTVPVWPINQCRDFTESSGCLNSAVIIIWGNACLIWFCIVYCGVVWSNIIHGEIWGCLWITDITLLYFYRFPFISMSISPMDDTLLIKFTLSLFVCKLTEKCWSHF